VILKLPRRKSSRATQRCTADLYNLDDNEVGLISTVRPKQQLLISTPELAKVTNLEVSGLYTNDPFDNRECRQAF
jgi:hypothetical protein